MYCFKLSLITLEQFFTGLLHRDRLQHRRNIVILTLNIIKSKHHYQSQCLSISHKQHKEKRKRKWPVNGKVNRFIGRIIITYDLSQHWRLVKNQFPIDGAYLPRRVLKLHYDSMLCVEICYLSVRYYRPARRGETCHLLYDIASLSGPVARTAQWLETVVHLKETHSIERWVRRYSYFG